MNPINDTFLGNFFRKDLNLRNHWWHRLFSVVFICAFILAVLASIVSFSESDVFRGGAVQQWEISNTIPERVTSEPKPIITLLKADEKIGENDRTYVLNDTPDDYYRSIINDVYCASNLSANFEKIQRNIGELYIGPPFNRVKVSKDEFINHINQNNVLCLMIDSYTTYDLVGNANGKLYFLNADKSFHNNWSFYAKSPTKTAAYFLEMILVVLASSALFFLLAMIVYFKIFLYIVFGSRKPE